MQEVFAFYVGRCRTSRGSQFIHLAISAEPRGLVAVQTPDVCTLEATMALTMLLLTKLHPARFQVQNYQWK